MVYLPSVFRRTTQSITWNECLASQHWPLWVPGVAKKLITDLGLALSSSVANCPLYGQRGLRNRLQLLQLLGSGQPKRPPVDSAESSGGYATFFAGYPIFPVGARRVNWSNVVPGGTLVGEPRRRLRALLVNFETAQLSRRKP
jgi:hypothetical protein